MTAEEIRECGIPVEDMSDCAVLAVQSALEYIKANTDLNFDLESIDDIKSLPACVKLFVVKYT